MSTPTESSYASAPKRGCRETIIGLACDDRNFLNDRTHRALFLDGEAMHFARALHTAAQHPATTRGWEVMDIPNDGGDEYLARMRAAGVPGARVHQTSIERFLVDRPVSEESHLKYDLVWLDFCRTLKTQQGTFDHLFQHIAEHCILAVTVSMRNTGTGYGGEDDSADTDAEDNGACCWDHFSVNRHEAYMTKELQRRALPHGLDVQFHEHTTYTGCMLCVYYKVTPVSEQLMGRHVEVTRLSDNVDGAEDEIHRIVRVIHDKTQGLCVYTLPRAEETSAAPANPFWQRLYDGCTRLLPKNYAFVDSSADTATGRFYEVERLLRYSPQRDRYLVRWRGYSEAEDTWEPGTSFPGSFRGAMRDLRRLAVKKRLVDELDGLV